MSIIITWDFIPVIHFTTFSTVYNMIYRDFRLIVSGQKKCLNIGEIVFQKIQNLLLYLYPKFWMD